MNKNIKSDKRTLLQKAKFIETQAMITPPYSKFCLVVVGNIFFFYLNYKRYAHSENILNSERLKWDRVS